MNARTQTGIGPGIHSMPAVAYHADPCGTPSLSNSLLTVLLQKTPRHAWLRHPRLNPDYAPEADQSTFDLGTVAHALLLEGADVAAVIDADDWRTSAAKEARDKARLAGKIPMLPRQAQLILQMINAARDYIASTQLAGILDLDSGLAEPTLIWKDSGVMCRARPDKIAADFSVILDYKSTGADGPGEFIRRNIVAHGYDTQAVWYPRALAANGHRNARFLFLVQETFAPFMCYLVEPAESLIELANHKVTRGLSLWRDCLSRNHWPGYSTQVHQADAPVWAIKEEEFMA